MSDHPELRRVDAFPLQQDGKNLICLQDPLHFSKPLGVSPETFFVLCQLDGRHSLVDIQAAYSNKFKLGETPYNHAKAGGYPVRHISLLWPGTDNGFLTQFFLVIKFVVEKI